jgi:hypothetical protein
METLLVGVRGTPALRGRKRGQLTSIMFNPARRVKWRGFVVSAAQPCVPAVIKCASLLQIDELVYIQ